MTSITIPNELKITINTSIPGFQNIRYKPYMTFPNDKNDNAVQFNPLVKLKSSVIKTLPENVQKRQFLSKGLFQSLINSHGLTRNTSLAEATKNGYIDNNIKVTLETLFPSNSVLYVNKQPYAIADVQWTKGDWKIDKKIQEIPEIDSNKISDPYLYRTIVKDEIISGENEIKSLPKEVVYGSNYTGPQNVASGVQPIKPSNNTTGSVNIQPSGPTIQPLKPSITTRKSLLNPNKPLKPSITTNKPPLKPIKPIQPALSPGVSVAYEAKEREIQNKFLQLVEQQKQLLQQQQFVSQQLLNQENKLSKEKKDLFLEQQQQISKEREKIKLQQDLLSQELNMLRLKFESQRLNMFRNKEIMNGNPFDNPPLPPPKPNRKLIKIPLLPPPKPNRKLIKIPLLPPPGPEIIDDDEIIENPLKKIVLETSVTSTEKLQNYFNSSDYYFMLNILFQNMEAAEKKQVNEIFKQSTGVYAKAVKGLSKTAYDITVNNMRVIKNAGGGDCYFIAIADAINYYNENQNVVSEKIVYNNYGKNIPFTQRALRELVGLYIVYKNNIPFEELVTILEDNVNNMNNMFQFEYEKLRKDVENITPNIFDDLINYIYFNDENDNFLVKKPTEMTSETLKTPFRMIRGNELESYITSSDYWGNPMAINALCELLGLNVIVIENKNNMMRIPYIYDGNKEWKKYLFILNKSNHYELITFDYIFNVEKEPVTKTIFRNNVLTPPFYIIFLIFASNYFKIEDPENKKNYKILPNLMKKLFSIYNKIEVTSKSSKNKTIKQDTNKFLKFFKDYFLKPPDMIRSRSNSLDTLSFKTKSEDSYDGGALSPYQRRYPSQFPSQFPSSSPYVSNFIKNRDSSQIDTPQSNISYYITIDMYLKKGEELSNKDKSNLKCDHRWNSIRKNYANLFGLNYTPKPDYTNMMPISNTKNKSKSQKRGLNLNNRNNYKTKRRNYLSS